MGGQHGLRFSEGLLIQSAVNCDVHDKRSLAAVIILLNTAICLRFCAANAPCLSEFLLEIAFPAWVFGPVDFSQGFQCWI